MAPASPPSPPSPASRRRRARLRAVATLAAVSVLGLSSIGWAAITYGESRIGRVDVFSGLRDRPGRGAGDAVNFLIVGSDTREGLSKQERRSLRVGSVESAAGRRSDTMLLAHVSRARQTVTVVSLPRDSYVEIPGNGRNKLNASYSIGGPALAVATVERNTGVRIDHYVEVNFAGFARMVDAIGGVDVCVPERIVDPKAHLELAPGRHRLDGVTSLKYVRAREFDNRGDVGRMERQQAFLGAVLREATSAGTLANPVRVTRLADAVLSAVTTDPGLRRDDVLDVARRLRGLSGDAVDFVTVPISTVNYRPGGLGATVLWDEAAAKQLFANLREDRPVDAVDPSAPRPVPPPRPTVRPGDISVVALNAAGLRGIATRASRDLAAAGFTVARGPGNAPTSTATATVIRYDPRLRRAVPTLAAAIPGARTQPVPGLGDTMEVWVSSAWAGATPVAVGRAAPTPTATPAVKRRTAVQADPCA